MALTIFDSFDSGDLQRWTPPLSALPAGVTYHSTFGIAGGGAVRLGTTLVNTAPFIQLEGFGPIIGQHFRQAFYVRFNGITFSDAVTSPLLVQRNASSTYNALARVTSAGAIALYDQGLSNAASQPPLVVTAVSPTGQNILDGRYHAFEWDRIYNGASSVYKLWIDGVLWTNTTFTTVLTGSAVFPGFSNNGATVGSVDFDDIVLWDDRVFAGIYDFVGAMPLYASGNRFRFQALNPNSDVADAGTPYTLVGGTTKNGILQQPFTGLAQGTYLQGNGQTTQIFAGIGFQSVLSNPSAIPFVADVMYYENTSGAGQSFNSQSTMDGVVLTTYINMVGNNLNSALVSANPAASSGASAPWTKTRLNSASSQINSPTPSSAQSGKLFKVLREALLIEAVPSAYVVNNVTC